MFQSQGFVSGRSSCHVWFYCLSQMFKWGRFAIFSLGDLALNLIKGCKMQQDRVLEKEIQTLMKFGRLSPCRTAMLVLLTFLLNPPVFSSNPPSGVQWVLKGKDRATGRDCSLFVFDRRETAQGIEYLVTVSYSHGADRLEPIVLSYQSPTVLQGRTKDSSSLTLFFDQEGFELSSASRFHLRWWHVNHWHNSVCHSLKLSP